MGFFDSFNESFNKESQESARRQERSSYQTVKQKKSGHFNDLNSQSDSVLLGKMNGIFTSDEDKTIIDGILKNRGYRKAANGTYHRR